MCSVHTRTLSKNFIDFWQKSFLKLTKLLFTCSDDHFDGKHVFLKISFFRLWWKLSLTLAIFFENLSKLLSTRSDDLFHKFFFWEILFRLMFGLWAKYFLTLGKNFIKRLSKLFSKSSETFWRCGSFSIFFIFGANSDFDQFSFWHLAQIFA